MERRPELELLSHYRFGAAACVLMATFLVGIGSAAPNRSSVSEGLARFSMGASAAFWCAADATLRSRHEFWSAQWQLMITWPLSVPAYFISTRGRRALRSLLLAFVVLVAVAAAGRMLGAMLVAESLTDAA